MHEARMTEELKTKPPEGETKPPEEGDEDITVSIGEEAPPPVEEEAPPWVKGLRLKQKELTKQNRELRDKLKHATSTDDQSVALGAKPTLETCDFDAPKLEKELGNWYEKKSKVDEQKATAKRKQEVEAGAWEAQLASYNEKKSVLKVQDFDVAEESVKESFSETQQGLIIQGADNPALVIYALGNSPKYSKELSAIQDPVKFTAAMSKLEANLKVTKRQPSVKPEGTVKGSGNPGAGVESVLEKLRVEANKTGNFSEVVAYRRNMRKE